MCLPFSPFPMMRSCDPLLRTERRKCQSWSSQERRKKNSGRSSKNSSRRAERNMNLSSNDTLTLLRCDRETICTMSYYSSCCSQCISSSHVHRFTPLYSYNPYFIICHCQLLADRAFSSCSLAHGESPFHSSLRTSLDGRVIWGRPNCSMVYDEDTVA